MRMFDEEKRIGNAPSAAIFNQRPLQCERVGIWHAAESSDVEDACLTHPPVPPFLPALPS